MKRRIISIITALALCLSLCPTWAFAAEAENKFAAGDTYAFTVAAPTTSNEAILSAMERVYKSHANIEAVHIVGTTNKDLWASLEAMAQTQETNAGRPLLIVCEQRSAGNDEAVTDYMEAIETDCKSAGRHVAVVQTWARFKGMDGHMSGISRLARARCWNLYRQALRICMRIWMLQDILHCAGIRDGMHGILQALTPVRRKTVISQQSSMRV